MESNHDIGFIISNKNSYIELKNLFSELLYHEPSNQYVCFSYDKDMPTNQLHMPYLPISEAKFWNGSLFVFNLEVIDIIKNFPSIDQIYYYLTEIEWLKYSHINYFDLKNIFEENNKIAIIAKNKNIYSTYKKCWKKNPIGIMEKLSYENFKNSVLPIK